MAEKNDGVLGSGKKIWKLKIDPEFQGLIPPMQKNELALLEEDLIKKGCLSPIITWGDIIVDGHNRFEICTRLGIPFRIEEIEFGNRDEAEIWIATNQMARRNITRFQKCEVVAKLEDRFRSEARERQGTRNDLNFVELVPQSELRTRDRLGKLAGVSGKTMERVLFIVHMADPATIEKLRSGEKTISSVYKELKKQAEEEEGAAAGKRPPAKPRRKHNPAGVGEGEKDAGKKEGNPFEETGDGLPLSENDGNGTPFLELKEHQPCGGTYGNEAESAAVGLPYVDAEAQQPDPVPKPARRGRKPTLEIPGTEMREEGLAHVARPMEDHAESFKYVIDQFRVSAEAYARYAFTGIEWMTPSMATDENMDILNRMVDEAAGRVKGMVSRRISELKKQISEKERGQQHE